MVRVPRHRRALRSTGLVSTLLIVAASLSAQITTELSDRAIAVGERVTYILTIDHEEPADVEVPALSFSGLRVVEGPTVRPVSLLTSAGRERAVEVRFVLEAVSAGRYILPSVEVRVAGQAYHTSERLLAIGERQFRARVPFLARWSGPDRDPLSGEAAVYALEIYNVPDYVYPSSISLGSPQNAIFEEIQGLGSIRQYSVDGVTLYAIPVAVFMVTPSQPGTMRLPEAEIVAESLRAVAPAQTIDVRQLPPAAEATGAVGRFAYAVSLEPATLLRSEAAVMTIRVEGQGNLHFLAVPEPQIVGFQVEYDETHRAYAATELGYQGSIERRVVLRPTSDERHAIEGSTFEYYDPSAGTIVRRQAAAIRASVVDANVPLDSTGVEMALSLLGRSELASMERRIWYNNALSYGWMVPGALVFIASRIWKRRQSALVVLFALSSLMLTDAVPDRLPWGDIDRGLRRYEEGNLTAAIAAFERASRAVPDSAGLNYNLAVLYFQVGDVPRSVYAAREAIRLAPMSERSRLLLQSVERWAGIERSVGPPHFAHPDLFFLVLALLVNALFVGLAFARGYRKARAVIGATLLALLIAGSIAGLAVTAVRHERQLAIIRVDVTLRRIPASEADGWLPVSRGAAVRVLARHGDALLVQTVLGLEGWIDLEDLLWDGTPALAVMRYRGFAL